MLPIVSLLLVLVVSVLITRIASVALVHTGLSQESARFQARSAFTGVGFTTAESEQVVNHPVRRRILLLLMLFGNAGIVTAVTSLLLTFLPRQSAGRIGLKLGLLVAGIVVIWGAVQSRWLDRALFRIVSRALQKYTELDVRDYASLLRLSGGYRVTELQVEPQDWIAHKSIAELRLADEGVLILGIIRKNGHYVGSPKAQAQIEPGDTLLLYGRLSNLDALDKRQRGAQGDKEHEAAVEEQEKVRNSEEKAIGC